MALLHHEVILPVVATGTTAIGFWLVVGLAYLAAVLHKLKHLWVWIRYGSEPDLTVKAPPVCELCGNRDDDLSLIAHRVDGLYNEDWMCPNCKAATVAFEVAR